MSLSTGILCTKPYPITTLHKELSWSTGTGCVLPVTSVCSFPVHITILALASGPTRLCIVTEKLALAARSFCFQLEALAQWFEVIWKRRLADAFTCGRCVVVGEERTQLAGTTREVLIAKFERCIVVLRQK